MAPTPGNVYNNRFYAWGFDCRQFQFLWQFLLLLDEPRAYVIDSISGGDGGFDVYNDHDYCYYAVYYPEKPRDPYDQCKKKFLADIAVARSRSASSSLSIDAWHFITPFDPDIKMLSIAKEECAALAFDVILWGQLKFFALLSKHMQAVRNLIACQLTDLPLAFQAAVRAQAFV